MVYFEFANSRNAGPHSVVGLLFRFQRPSKTPGSELLLSNPSLERSRSPEDFRLSSSGGVDLLPLPGFVKKDPSASSLPSLRDLRGGDF